tara:strand:+ start:389 stop:628 length:240 start_codon:yes stop_codon:yes gene_type:complete
MNREESNKSQITIDQKLIDEGTAQLTNEIKVLESWLNELDAAESADPESKAARKSYNDMLKSRKEMLNTLNKQSKIQPL